MLDPRGRAAPRASTLGGTTASETLITKLARQAGLTAATEQAMLILNQMGSLPRPGCATHPLSQCSHHRLRAVARRQGPHAGPNLAIAKELPKEEQAKCRAYGQHHGYNPQALDRGMTTIVLEQFGRTDLGARAIFNRVIHHRPQLLV